MLFRFFAVLVLLLSGTGRAVSGPALAHKALAGIVRRSADSSLFISAVGTTADSVVVTTSDEFTVESYSLDDYSLRWRQKIGPQFGETRFTSDVTYVAENALYLPGTEDESSPASDGYEFAAIDNRSGEYVWNRKLESAATFMGIVDNVVLLWVGEGTEGVDARTGATIWRQPFWISPSEMVVTDNSVVGFTNLYASIFQGDSAPAIELVSIDAASGRINWRQRAAVTDDVRVQGTDGGSLLTSDDENEKTVVTAWDLTSGAISWQRVFDDAMWVVCRQDQVCVLHEAIREDLYNIKLSMPDLVGSPITLSLGVLPISAEFRGNSLVVIGHCLEQVENVDCATQYALIDLKVARVKWTQVIGGRFMYPNLSTDVVYDAGLVYFDTRVGVNVMNEANGQIEWGYELPPDHVTTSFRVSSGTVVLAVQDKAREVGYILVLDAPVDS